ncbi:MAG: GtrA family protein [Clostridia bacterium]|nr:GtrA family protein [Clostridia bacterium]
MFGKLKELYVKNKEVILYLIFGVGTTAVDFIVSYALYPTDINIHAVHVIAWISAVAFAYITNRIFVFESRSKGITVIFEIIKFAGSRIVTFLIQEAIVFLLFDVMKLSEYVVKIPAAVLVVILNYVFSRLLVFRKGDKDE